jgi:hypothetical protein
MFRRCLRANKEQKTDLPALSCSVRVLVCVGACVVVGFYFLIVVRGKTSFLTPIAFITHGYYLSSYPFSPSFSLSPLLPFSPFLFSPFPFSPFTLYPFSPFPLYPFALSQI